MIERIAVLLAERGRVRERGIDGDPLVRNSESVERLEDACSYVHDRLKHAARGTHKAAVMSPNRYTSVSDRLRSGGPTESDREESAFLISGFPRKSACPAAVSYVSAGGVTLATRNNRSLDGAGRPRRGMGETTMARNVSRRVFALAGLLGLIAFGDPVSAAENHPSVVRTRSLIPPPDGYLYCVVSASSTTPIGIIARILNEGRADITAYGSSFRASPDVTGDLYYAEETAGTVIDDAGFCEGMVTGARKGNVHVKLTAHEADGQKVDEVTR